MSLLSGKINILPQSLLTYNSLNGKLKGYSTLRVTATEKYNFISSYFDSKVTLVG